MLRPSPSAPTATPTAAPASAAPQAIASDGGGETDAASATEPSAVVPTVPGYDVGQFPPVPLFLLPDISLLDESLGGFALDLGTDIEERRGLKISPAACGDARERATGQGTALLYGDGSGTFTGPDGTVTNYGDGSGTFTIGDTTATVYGDGSGSLETPELTIWNYGDGSGSITDETGETWVYGDGSGSFEGGGVTHWNYGDGTATYKDGTVEIWNHGDGGGSYTDGTIEIRNYGDGTGTVDDIPIEVAPIAPEAPIGDFPPLGTIAPLESCGTTITFEDGVLFDFGKHDVRPDAATVLDQVAAALVDMKVPEAEVGGHTDSISSEEFNQALSERRANAVVTALQERGVTTALSAQGYGESAPVAPNEVDGHDNPAGRQLNRRVEIFIPAF
jgi:OOP family OmpA-OmpF porin